MFQRMRHRHRTRLGQDTRPRIILAWRTRGPGAARAHPKVTRGRECARAQTAGRPRAKRMSASAAATRCACLRRFLLLVSDRCRAAVPHLKGLSEAHLVADEHTSVALQPEENPLRYNTTRNRHEKSQRSNMKLCKACKVSTCRWKGISASRKVSGRKLKSWQLSAVDSVDVIRKKQASRESYITRRQFSPYLARKKLGCFLQQADLHKPAVQNWSTCRKIGLQTDSVDPGCESSQLSKP